MRTFLFHRSGSRQFRARSFPRGHDHRRKRRANHARKHNLASAVALNHALPRLLSSVVSLTPCNCDAHYISHDRKRSTRLSSLFLHDHAAGWLLLNNTALFTFFPSITLIANQNNTTQSKQRSRLRRSPHHRHLLRDRSGNRKYPRSLLTSDFSTPSTTPQTSTRSMRK